MNAVYGGGSGRLLVNRIWLEADFQGQTFQGKE